MENLTVLDQDKPACEPQRHVTATKREINHAREAALTRQREFIPKKYISVWERAHKGRSKATALKAKCQDCVGWELPVQNIGQCTSYACPIWPYRPYQDKTE